MIVALNGKQICIAMYLDPYVSVILKLILTAMSSWNFTKWARVKYSKKNR